MKHARKDYNRIQDPDGLIPEDEPVFLIRGQDTAGPGAVEVWAMLAEALGADEKIIYAARLQALEMQKYQSELQNKVPDLRPEDSVNATRKQYAIDKVLQKLDTYVDEKELANIESSIERILDEDDTKLDTKLATNVGYQMRLRFGHVKWLQFLKLAQEAKKNND